MPTDLSKYTDEELMSLLDEKSPEEKQQLNIFDLMRKSPRFGGTSMILDLLARGGGEVKKLIPGEGLPSRAARALIPSSRGEVLAQAAAGPVLSKLGALGKLGAKGIGALLPRVRPRAVQRIFESEKSVLPYFKEFPDLNAFLTNQASRIQGLKEQAGREVGNIVNIVNDRVGGQPVIAVGHLSKISKEALEELGIRSAADIPRSKVLGSPENTKRLLSILEEFKSKPIISPKRAWELRQQIQDLQDFTIQETGQELKKSSPKGYQVLKRIRDSIKSQLVNLDKDVAPIFEEFNKKATAHSLLMKNLFSGNPEQKAMSLLRGGNKLEKVLEKVDDLLPKKERFTEELKDITSAQEFKELHPRLAPTGLTTGLGMLGAISKPAAVAGILASSPRLFGLSTQLGTSVAKGLGQPVARQPLAQILMEMLRGNQ